MPSWKRVRDTTTGHQYDVDERLPLAEGVEAVKGAPVLSGRGARPRPAKPRRTVDAAVQTAREKRASQTRDITPTPVPDDPANSKE
ncbi:hypothetical protein [Oerskovia sp. Root22]|uniref:hypothetical protein n=1 Tax=Oerskovia sp. Root22 TaxID=1736494 RepID=UPI000701C07B|nr:hypothetical protein [Oerskovia sp. Root22]KRC37524.1 hypothetical protein ASE15_05265 [Oerskovia sp. Root22]